VSTDGAQNWQTVSRLAYGGDSPFISFLDTQTGWAASSEQLEATIDGGQTWVEIALPQEAATIAAITLRTAGDGYLLDNAGSLYITEDGGESWSLQTLGLDTEILTSLSIPLAAIRFFDADHGLIVLILMGEGDVLAMRTADGGQTWEQESVPAEFGPLYLTHDGTILTVTGTGGQITVLRYEEG